MASPPTACAPIVPVHLYGQCADLAPILAIAGAHGVAVVEDAAQAMGARYPSTRGDSAPLVIGTLGCFSFFPTKNLGALGDGGLVVTDDDALRAGSSPARPRRPGAPPRADRRNFRLDTLQAAALVVKLPVLERWHEARRRNAAYYDEEIDDKVLRKPLAAWGREAHIYNQYVIRVPDRRDDLKRFLAEREIGSRGVLPDPLPPPGLLRFLGYSRGDFPNAESAAEHTLALPVYPGLTREMQDCVIAAIRDFYA